MVTQSEAVTLTTRKKKKASKYKSIINKQIIPQEVESCHGHLLICPDYHGRSNLLLLLLLRCPLSGGLTGWPMWPFFPSLFVALQADFNVFLFCITTIAVTDSPSLELSHALPDSPVALRLSPNKPPSSFSLDSDVAAKPNKLAPTVEECCIIVACCVLNEWKENHPMAYREEEKEKEEGKKKRESQRGDFWTSRGPGARARYWWMTSESSGCPRVTLSKVFALQLWTPQQQHTHTHTDQ